MDLHIPYYPINDFGPFMKGMIIGGMGIFHVFMAQFAIGGGLLMCYFQWLAQTGRSPYARKFLDSYFTFLVLLSFVVGALTGVGMWFTSIQISPRTIGAMVDQFHWLWATEYTFFILEIVAGYVFYRYGARLADRARMGLLVTYSFAAWASLFWINGILSWQLTPGEWAETGSIWAGFFNPSFFPSTIFRTIVAMTIASLVACVVINTVPGWDREARRALINRAAHFLAPMALMPLVAAWFMYSIPEDSRTWALGGATTMTLFTSLAVGASMLIGLYAALALILRKAYINVFTALLLVALAFGATAGGEFVREGVRKPDTIRTTLLSNSIHHDEIAALRAVGSVERDPYPLRHAERYPNDQVRLGAKVYRFQCSICHTLKGANGLGFLTDTWTADQLRLNIANLQHTKPFMPPFSGNADELEALVQMLEWMNAGEPPQWPESRDPAIIRANAENIQAAGVLPSYKEETISTLEPAK